MTDTADATIGSNRLRIAFFSDSLPERNGTGAYYHDLAEHLGDRVDAVEVLQPLPGRRFNMLTLPLPGDRTQELALPNPFRLHRRIEALQPHIIVSVTPGPFGLMGMRLARRSRSAFISAYHTDFAALADLYWGPVKKRLGIRALDAVNRRLCRASAAVLVNNTELIDPVHALGAPRVEVMGTPIDRVFLATTPPPAPRAPDPVVFAGRLAAEKNIDGILEAARARPCQRFIIAGDGPQRERVVDATASLANLEYRGWLDRAALCDLLDEAGIVVLPSRFETFGSIALEAMVRRRPVLVTRNAGIHDWPRIADCVCALERTESLTGALARLDDAAADEWAELGERGRRGALRLHEETIEQWLHVLALYARMDDECGR